LCGHASFVDAHRLSAGSEPMGVLDVVKDLGVFTDCRLSFSKTT